MRKASKRIRGRSSSLTQWIVKYGYLPIVLIGMAGLALDSGTRQWKSNDVIVADAPVVAETLVERRPPALQTEAEPMPSVEVTGSVGAETSVERSPPTVEIKLEPKSTVQVAALDPD